MKKEFKSSTTIAFDSLLGSVVSKELRQYPMLQNSEFADFQSFMISSLLLHIVRSKCFRNRKIRHKRVDKDCAILQYSRDQIGQKQNMCTSCWFMLNELKMNQSNQVFHFIYTYHTFYLKTGEKTFSSKRRIEANVFITFVLLITFVYRKSVAARI